MATTTSPLPLFSYPRTGKRGVPQQFPRRLYEMLDSETKSVEASDNHRNVISWSTSGKAFKIFDVAEFASTILPKYFRTKKFSSFQRNLNLYGFAKVRRGADIDMYAHPFFVRDEPESLLKLRKTTTTSRRRLLSDASSLVDARSVSPTEAAVVPVLVHHANNIVIHGFNASWTQASSAQVSLEPKPILPLVHNSTSYPNSTKSSNDRGKLDLLAFALEQELAARS